MTNVFFYAATLAAFGVLLSGATGTPSPTPLLGSGAVSTLYTSPNGNVSLADHVLYEGFIYATDVTNRVVLRIDPYTAATTVLVGGKPGAAANAEGTGAAAGFTLPRGLAIHEDEGVLLVASVGAILRVDIDTQEVKLHAGQLNQEGFTPPSDGAQAYFRGIYGLTLISEAGDLLATEHTGQWVRFVSAGIAGIRSETWQRSVMVLAGGGIYYVGTVDGPLSLSRVNGPMFITYHAANGAAYFAENGGTGAVRKLAVAEKFLTTVFLAGASTVGISGVGLVPQAGSNDPLVYASIGSKTRAQFIAKVSPSYEVVAGSDVESGSVDGPGLSARFFDIYGPLRFYGGVYGSGFVFAHNGNGSASALRVLGQVNLAAPCASHGRPFRCHHRHETGGRGHHDWRLGNGHGGYRCQQSAITCDVFDGCTGLTCAGVVKCRDTRKCGSLAGHYCEVTGATVSVCSALVPRPTAPPPPPSPMPLANTTVSTVFLSAQDDPSLPWFSDGTFFEGFVYTTVSYANTIVRIDPVSKTYTTIAGGSPLGGNEEGVGTAASLDWPQGLVAQEEGYLLVTAGTAVMRVALADANVALYAGHPYRRGYDWDDGDGSVARFDTLQGIRLLNADGDCIVSDWGSNRIRNITAGSEGITGAPATRKVGSVAGDIYQWGLLDGVGTQAWFYAPWHMGYHQPNGALYVADIGNAAVRKIVLRTSVVTTIFVLDRSELQLWNIGLMASLNPFTTEPAVFATIGGGSGTIISQVSPTYEQVAGSLTAFGGADGPGLNATFYGIEGSLQYLSGAYGSGFLLTDNIDGRTSVRVLGDVNFNTACGAYGGEYQCSRWGRCRKSAITCEVLGGCTGPRCAGVVKCSRYSSCGSLAGHYCEVSGSDTFVCNAAPTNPPTPRSPYGHH